MNVTRLNEAPEYVAPNHVGMKCLRLQGREAGPAVQLWMGMSIVQPGGSTGVDTSPIEKHYFVVQGEVTVISEIDGVKKHEILRASDSCRIAPGETREVMNHTQHEARVLLAMPFHPPTNS